MATQLSASSKTAATPVSYDTKVLVEQQLAGEPDEIKQKMGELVDLIKNRASAELQEADSMTRETYVQVMARAQETLKKTETFFKDQEQSLEQSIQAFTNEAAEKWNKFVDDVETMNNRIDRAVEAAWKNLTE